MRAFIRGAAIAAAASLSLALPANAQLTEDISFNVHNNTDQTIVGVHITSTDDPSWGDDILDGTVAPGETMEVDITDNLPDCEYDVRVDFSGGTAMQLGEVNLCEFNGQTIDVLE